MPSDDSNKEDSHQSSKPKSGALGIGSYLGISILTLITLILLELYVHQTLGIVLGLAAIGVLFSVLALRRFK